MRSLSILLSCSAGKLTNNLFFYCARSRSASSAPGPDASRNGGLGGEESSLLGDSRRPSSAATLHLLSASWTVHSVCKCSSNAIDSWILGAHSSGNVKAGLQLTFLHLEHHRQLDFGSGITGPSKFEFLNCRQTDFPN